MARRNKQKKQEEETLVDVVGRVETVQDYVEQNKSTIMMVIGAIVLIVAAVTAYGLLYKAPRNAEAVEIIQHAQLKFDKDKFAEALDGDTLNTNHGFLDIIDNYSGTQSANLAKYYAGICYLNLGNYDVAKGYLSEFKDKGKVLGSFKYAALGDAHAELNENDKALSNYEKATKTNPNEFATPIHLMKYGMFLESQGKKDQARSAYEKIKNEYPTSAQAVEAEKFLARVGG